MGLKSYFDHAKYVVRHKYYVYREGRKLGLSRTRMLIHDYQKFLPAEWGPYARTHFGGESVRRKDGGYDPTAQSDDFRRAWLHHWHLGSHHWQAHCEIKPDGTVVPLPMPEKDRLEMLADWRGAGITFGKPDTRAWYEANRDEMILHPETREWIESQLYPA
jgi:hypothetical protein